MEKFSFGTLNYTVVVVYLLSIIGVGVYFLRRQKTTDDYFKGGGRVPGWAAGLSVYATTLSSITFMTIPAKAYTADWTWIIGQYLVIAIFPFIFYFYIPFFRKLKITSVYEYLETRFDIKSRLFASISFMLYHVGRIAIITHLTILAVKPFLGIDPVYLAILFSLLCIVYTWMGGIEGVIWTDVIQGILLAGGLLLTLIIVFFKVDGGASEVIRVTAEADKFFPSSQFTWSWKDATIPVLLMGFLFNNLQQFTASQDVVQRYIVTKSMKETKRTFITSALMTGFFAPVIFMLGSALFVYYLQNPALLPDNFNTSGIVPHFIVRELPAGLSGLVLAGLLAAAQSSISSSLNSISSCFNSDIYRRLSGQERSPKECMRTAQIVVIVTGILSCLASLYLITADKSELWDMFNSLLGLMGGPMTGLFLLGIFIKRANAGSAVCGIIASIILMLVVKNVCELNFFFYGVVGALSVVFIGAVTAPFFHSKPPIVLPEEE